MRRFSAQYIITGTGTILKRGIITTSSDGTITDIMDTGGKLPELSNTEFYNGIIIPGFINCHCHLELSPLKGKIEKQTGLGDFVGKVRETRPKPDDESEKYILEAHKKMYADGVSACADICNSPATFQIKEEGPIKYVNLLEVFGIDPEKAEKRISEILELKKIADRYSAPSFIVPHSFYSMSGSLLKRLMELASSNAISSIHFMESAQEQELLAGASGQLMESYRAMGIDESMLRDSVPDHITGLKEYLTAEGNLILVHNTWIEREHIRAAKERANTFFCLCPGSNIYIENRLPPLDILLEEEADIIIGTDSLASNDELSMIDELKILSSAFPGIELSKLISWATVNGARALRMDEKLGTIETGKTPGLVLIENCDLERLSLLKSSRTRRLI